MNNTALAIIQPDELETIQRTARLLAVSNYFDGKGDTPQAIAMMATKILAGREMGFGPFASVNGIHIISGKPSVGANLMASAVKSSARYDYRVKEMSNDKCVIEFFERAPEGHPDKRVSIGVSEFTKADATAAGTQNMTKFPRNMLFARAMSNGVRWYCPDIFSGNAVYVPEELGAEVDGDGNIVEATYSVTQPTERIDDYTEPRYAHLIDQLTGDCLERANRARKIHAQSKGPASPDQYRFLAGTIDDIVRHDGGHKAVLEVFVGRAVNGDNPPGTQLAGKLLDALLEFRTVEVDGEKVKEPNPEYKPDAVACVHSIWHLVRAEDGQTSLFEQEPQATAA